MEIDLRSTINGLLARLGDGDRTAGPDLFRLLWPVLHEFCARLLSNSTTAEDAAQRAITRLFAQANRFGWPLSMIMLDIDHFKEYNDAFGHPAGDQVLQQVGATLRSNLRSHDVVARYGGEEFVVLLPATAEDAALDVAERLRAAIAGREWPHRSVTASFGVATSGAEAPDAATLVDHADRALYHSKEAGRDRTSHYDRCSVPSYQS